MSEVSNNVSFSPQEIDEFNRKTTLAINVAREAVQRMNIPKDSPAETQEQNPYWKVFYQDVGDNIGLSILLNPLTTKANFQCSLGHTVLELVDDLETLLSDAEAMRLFQVSEEEKDEVIFERLVGLTITYIGHLPVVLYHSLYQAVNESMINHIKKIVEPLYRQELEFSDRENALNLLPNNSLNDIVKLFPNLDFRLLKYLEITDKQYKDYRKNVYSNRQVFLTPERFENLHHEYDLIRADFQKIKKEFEKRRDAYFLINPNAGNDDWNKHWEKYLEENFPLLSYSYLDRERTPSELAYRYLANDLDYHPDTIERKVIESRALAKERRRREQSNKLSINQFKKTDN
jgi:hypothetical protein